MFVIPRILLFPSFIYGHSEILSIKGRTKAFLRFTSSKYLKEFDKVKKKRSRRWEGGIFLYPCNFFLVVVAVMRKSPAI